MEVRIVRLKAKERFLIYIVDNPIVTKKPSVNTCEPFVVFVF